MKEEDLAKFLKLHPKQLRRTLRVLEEEMLVVREHRREVCFQLLWCQLCIGIEDLELLDLEWKNFIAFELY